ncbi:MAG: hypothetical protein Q8R74_01810 [Methylophilus sp.]|jgi:hypothetical protein|nr:hypothetical protein [Methylophilus sp.]
MNKSMVEMMEERYGPIISGVNLRTALGFNTYAAFYRSMQLEELGVKVFRLAGRKGWFAKTADVADWIEKQSKGDRK